MNTANCSCPHRGEEQKSYEGGNFFYHYEGIDIMHPDDEEASNVTGVSDFTGVSNFKGVIDHVYPPGYVDEESKEEYEESVLTLINQKKLQVKRSKRRGRRQQNHSPTDPVEFENQNQDRFMKHSSPSWE